MSERQIRATQGPYSGVEGWAEAPNGDQVDLGYVKWEESDDDLLWIGQYGGIEDWAVSMNVPGPVIFRCSLDQVDDFACQLTALVAEGRRVLSAPTAEETQWVADDDFTQLTFQPDATWENR